MIDLSFRSHLRSQGLPFSRGIVCAIGLLFGIACTAVLTPLSTLVALAGIGLLWGALKRPEVLPLAYLVLTSSIIAISQGPHFSIGFATLYLTDLILLLSFGIIIVRSICQPAFTIVRTPLDWPLLFFGSASLLSTLIAVSGSSLPWKDSLGEIRVVSSYLLFFVVTNLVREKRQFVLLVRGFLFLATVVALLMLLQYFYGPAQVILAGRIEDLDVEGQSVPGAVRIIPPGQSIVLVSFIAVFASLALNKTSVSRVLHCGLLAVALILTFFRATWLMACVTILLIALLATAQAKKRLLLSALMAAALAAPAMIVVLQQSRSAGASLVHAASARALSLFQTRTYQDPQSSLRWRDFEYKYALPHILKNPLLGIGLGVRYRPLTQKDHETFDGRTYLHNGHVSVLLKSGIFGYAALMCFLVGALFRGIKYHRNLPDPVTRSLVLAFGLAFLDILIISIVEPYVLMAVWTPVIAFIAGINETVLRRPLPA